MKFKAKLKSLMMAGTFALCMNASVGVSPAYAICETNAEVITSQGNAITQQAQAVTQIIADLQASISSIIPVELTDLLSKITGLSTSFRTGMGETWANWEEALED